MPAETLRLAVQDTTELNHSLHPKTELLGPIRDKEGLIGMLVHDTTAYRVSGTAQGLIDVQCWTRDPDLKRTDRERYALPIRQKESYKWLASWKAAVHLQEQCAESTVIIVGDREPDVYELLVEAQKESKAKLLVRANQQRPRPTEGEEEGGLGNVWEWMVSCRVEGILPLESPRTPQRKARSARLEVPYAEAKLQAPQRKPKLGSVRVWVVTAAEVGAPIGEEPVEWKLITTPQVKILAQARDRGRSYLVRKTGFCRLRFPHTLLGSLPCPKRLSQAPFLPPQPLQHPFSDRLIAPPGAISLPKANLICPSTVFFRWKIGEIGLADWPEGLIGSIFFETRGTFVYVETL